MVACVLVIQLDIRVGAVPVGKAGTVTFLSSAVFDLQAAIRMTAHVQAVWIDTHLSAESVVR